MSDQNNIITHTPARAKWIFDSTMEWNLSLHSHPSVVVVLVRRAPRDDSASGSGGGGMGASGSGSEWVHPRLQHMLLNLRYLLRTSLCSQI